MNEWCKWRAQQFRNDGLEDRALEWEARAATEPAPDPAFVWPRGFTRQSAVDRVQSVAPGMPGDASDFYVLGMLNTVLDSRTRADAKGVGGGGGGNPNHDNHGRFAAGSSAKAHAATAAATSPEGHQHAAALHEHAASAHRTAGNGTMANAHDMIAQHHKTEAAASGHSGPGHEHSEHAMAATDKAYRSAPGAEHTEANHAAARAHDVASAVHSKEGHTAAADEHARLADQHRSVIGTDLRMRPSALQSRDAYKPAPPPERYVAPKASTGAKAASKAAEEGERSLGVKGDDAHKAPLSSFLDAAKLHDAAATAHGQGWEADYHRNTANAYREIGTGAKPRPVYSKYR